jgi:hypothetical protein
VRLEFTYFPDTDGDGILDDAPDKCRKQPGISRFGGCPPELRATPRVSYMTIGSGLRITNLEIDDMPKGARAEVRCGRTVKQRAKRKGTLKVGGCTGRTVNGGGSIQVRVTLGRTGKGQYQLRRRRQVLPLAGLGRQARQAQDELPAARLRKPTKCR